MIEALAKVAEVATETAESASEAEIDPDARIETENSGDETSQNAEVDPDARIENHASDEEKPIDDSRTDDNGNVYKDESGDVPRLEQTVSDTKSESQKGMMEIADTDIPQVEDANADSDSFCDSGSNDNQELNLHNDDIQEDVEVEELKEQYIEELLDYSDCPETIDVNKFRESKLEKIEPEENGKRREEFNQKKEELIEEWEAKNGRAWPRYEKDVYSENGKLIRKMGQRYDAHHVQPLGMGGENTADNITPLHAEDHYDRQGIHSIDSAYSKLETKLEQKG